MEQKWTRFLSAVSVSFLMILSGSVLQTGSFLTQTTQTPYDAGVMAEEPEDYRNEWAYRKLHTLIGSAGAGSNYQIEIVVNFGSGVDSGKTVYVRGLCKEDFGDIRFTDNDGMTPLSYWLDTKNTVAGSYATFWVKVTDDLSYTQSIYVYFGNGQAVTTSDPDATFIFFDDFESGSLDKWDTHTLWVRVQDKTYDGSWSVVNRGVSGQGTLQKNILLTDGFRVHAAYYSTYISGYSGYPFMARDEASSLIYAGVIRNDHMSYYDGSAYWAWHDLTQKTWLVDEFGYDPSFSIVDCLFNGVWQDVYNLVDRYGGTVEYVTALTAFGVAVSGKDLYLDQYYVRKWIIMEPQHGTWSEREFSDGRADMAEWKYCIPHSIIGNQQHTLLNYQMQFFVHRSEGTSSGDSVFLGYSVQTDFDDVRFVDQAERLLSYCLIGVVGDTAEFWVRMSADLRYDTLVYLYYGNEQAISRSDGSKTFIFYDGFSGATVSTDIWNISEYGSYASRYYEVANGELHVHAVSTVEYETTGYAFESTATISDTCFIAYAKGRWASLDYYRGGGEFQGLRLSDTDTHCTGLSVNLRGDSRVVLYSAIDGTYTQVANPTDYTSGATLYAYYAHPVGQTSTSFDLDLSGRYSYHVFQSPDGFTFPFRVNLYALIRYWTWESGVSVDTYYDYVYVREFTHFEPAHGEWGDAIVYENSIPSFFDHTVQNWGFQDGLGSWSLLSGSWSPQSSNGFTDDATPSGKESLLLMSSGGVYTAAIQQMILPSISGALCGRSIEFTFLFSCGASGVSGLSGRAVIRYVTYGESDLYDKGLWFGPVSDDTWYSPKVYSRVPEDFNEMWVQIYLTCEAPGTGGYIGYVDTVRLSVFSKIGSACTPGQLVLTLSARENDLDSDLSICTQDLELVIRAETAEGYHVGVVWLFIYLEPYVSGQYPYTTQHGELEIESISESNDVSYITRPLGDVDPSSALRAAEAISFCLAILIGAATGVVTSVAGPVAGVAAVEVSLVSWCVIYSFLEEAISEGAKQAIVGAVSPNDIPDAGNLEYHSEAYYAKAASHYHDPFPTEASLSHALEWQYKYNQADCGEYRIRVVGSVQWLQCTAPHVYVNAGTTTLTMLVEPSFIP